MRARIFVCALALAGAAPAQDANAELERLRRQLQNQRAEAERLLELRIRHDLGMPIVADVLEGAGRVAATSDAMAKAKRELVEQDAVTANLHQRFRQLSASVAQLQRDAAQAHAENLSETPLQIDVPSVGAVVPRVTTQPAPAPGGEIAAPRVVAPAPLAEIATELDPVAAQIHGSEDHLRVAQTLLRAAQQLVDRGFELRRAEQAEPAAQLDGRAKDRLQRAVAELEPLLGGEAPPYAALFCKGRCLELLFRIDERHAGLSLQRSAKEFQTREAEVRAPFLEISARDVEANPTPGGQPRMGRWGIAAQTALEHFRWMNVRGNWQPKISLDSLQWGKQKP